MRPLAITQNITLDGSIEMLGDWFGPQGRGDMSDVQTEQQAQGSRADAFLLGRRTFEDLRGYWRDLTDDTTGVSDHLNTVQQYVVSGTLTDPGWQHETVLDGDVSAQGAGAQGSRTAPTSWRPGHHAHAFAG